MHDLTVFLDYLSRVIAIVLAIGAAFAFVFKSVVNGWIDAYFAQRLEKSKADLTRELTSEMERLKSRLGEDLEKRKRELDESFRRRQLVSDKALQYFDEFNTGFGTVFVELHALEANYFKPLEQESLELAKSLRSSTVLKIHRMLVEAQEKLRPFDAYVPVDLARREAQLFRDLSWYIGDAANDHIHDLAASGVEMIDSERNEIWK